MNYLAHLLLSGDDDDILVGNYITDGIKGEDKSGYKKRVLDGISLHRKIDEFTDAHFIFGKSAQRIKPKYGLYAWVIIDIYYDHFLASNWKEYSEIPLRNYSQNVYALLDKRINELPKHSQRFLMYMKKYDVLFNYSKLEGIESVLKGLSTRTRFESKIDQSIIELKEHYADFENDFKSFFPELLHFVSEQEEVKK